MRRRVLQALGAALVVLVVVWFVRRVPEDEQAFYAGDHGGSVGFVQAQASSVNFDTAPFPIFSRHGAESTGHRWSKDELDRFTRDDCNLCSGNSCTAMWCPWLCPELDIYSRSGGPRLTEKEALHRER